MSRPRLSAIWRKYYCRRGGFRHNCYHDAVCSVAEASYGWRIFKTTEKLKRTKDKATKRTNEVFKTHKRTLQKKVKASKNKRMPNKKQSKKPSKQIIDFLGLRFLLKLYRVRTFSILFWNTIFRFFKIMFQPYEFIKNRNQYHSIRNSQLIYIFIVLQWFSFFPSRFGP